MVRIGRIDPIQVLAKVEPPIDTIETYDHSTSASVMDQEGVDAGGGRSGALSAGAGLGFLPRALRGVVFDLDGTLLDTEPAYRAAFAAALAQLGHVIAPAEYDRLVGLPSSTRRLVLARLFGAAFPVEVFFETYYRFRRAALAGGIAPKPGAVALLDALDDACLPHAIATSASAPTALAHLALAGLAGRFACVVTRDDVAHGKPAPDSFARAAGILGVPAANCLAIEDSYHGILAAHAAGLMVVMVPDALPPTAETRRCCLTTVEGLPALTAALAPALMQPHPTMDRSRLRV